MAVMLESQFYIKIMNTNGISFSSSRRLQRSKIKENGE